MFCQETDSAIESADVIAYESAEEMMEETMEETMEEERSRKESSNSNTSTSSADSNVSIQGDQHSNSLAGTPAKVVLTTMQ